MNRELYLAHFPQETSLLKIFRQFAIKVLAAQLSGIPSFFAKFSFSAGSAPEKVLRMCVFVCKNQISCKRQTDNELRQ